MKRSYQKLLKYFFLRKPKTPFQLIHFVTSRCNAKCAHCFYWKNLNTKEELSLEEIEKITKHLPDLVILNISGGEPFLRPDFAEVIKTYYHNTPVKEVTVPTNGTLTPKIIADCKNILDHCPDLDLNIVFSLDGIENIHNEIRQIKDCFKLAKTSLRALQELQKQYPRLQISVVSTLTSLNQNTLEEFHQMVKKELKPDVFSLNLIRGEAKKMDLFGVNLNHYQKFYELESKSKKKGLKILFRDFLNKVRMETIIESVEKKKGLLPCRAGTMLGVMYENGDVYPCELLNNKPLGNIRNFDYDFTKLWASPTAKNAVKFIKDSKCYCTHECFLRFNILYHPPLLGKKLILALLGKRKWKIELPPEQGNQGKELIQLGLIRGIRPVSRANLPSQLPHQDQPPEKKS